VSGFHWIFDQTNSAISGKKQQMSNLKGKVAIVTGASKGIGAAIATALAADGAAVVVNYASDQKGADAVVATIERAGGKGFAVHGDVAEPGGAESIVEAAIKKFGQVDVLVNNAGIYQFNAIEAVDAEHFHRIFNTNVLGLLLSTKAAVKHMKAGASIINIGSAVTSMLPPQSAVYTGTKGAVDAITGVLANELGAKQIRVNSINPGIVDTEGSRSAGFIGSDFEKGAVQHTPLGRSGKPTDIASVAVFLASDNSYWLTGEKLVASGGLR
jgi:3-oxoacyl-[acyl-carrier protein] reductase